VLVFPGAEALAHTTSQQLEQPGPFDFIVRSGRAVVHPVYRGTYERHLNLSRPEKTSRENRIRWAQDVRRALDYVETRPEFDLGKVAYFGTSMGAGFGPIPLALDERFDVALLVGGGLVPIPQEPELDAVNFAPRVKVPTLLLSGRYDFFFPYETSQVPLFERLGAPSDQKRHTTANSGHSVPRREYVREVLGWLDKYFGRAK
jgi:pimeloyl-ACP methyl ester carboxylesterase